MSSPAAAPRARRLRTAATGAAFALVYLYAFPYFGGLKNANELPRVLTTQELVERGTFAIDARLGEMGSMFDVATTPDGRHYSNKAPGPSILAVPVYVVARALAPVCSADLAVSTWLFRISVATLPALLFLPIFLGVARRFAPTATDRPAKAALCAYGLGSLMLPCALLFMGHAPAAAAVGAAFALAIPLVRGEARRPTLGMFGVGALAGLAILCDYQAALGAWVVVLYALTGAPRRLRGAAALAAGAAPFAILLLTIHLICFGAPWTTGYSFSPDVAHREGFLGIVGPNRPALWRVLLAPNNGLLVLSPWVLLAGVGGVSIARHAAARARIGIEAAVAVTISAGYVLLVGSLAPEIARGGWSVGPRYLAVALPFFGWLAAAGLAAVDGQAVGRTLAHTLVLVGVLVHVIAATTYPHWPEVFANPLHEVSLRALHEGLAPHSLGTLAGFGGPFSLAPLYLAAAGLCGALLCDREGRDWAPTLAAASLAAAVVLAGYARLPRSGPESEEIWRFVRSTWEPIR